MSIVEQAKAAAAKIDAQRAAAKPNSRAKRDADAYASSGARQLDVVMAGSIEMNDEAFADELIEGIIGRIALAVLYGDSNSGKTFLAVDLASAVSQSADWMGRPTDGGLVVYLAAEAPGSVLMRFKARQRYHGSRLPLVAVVRSPVNFFDGAGDVSAVIALVKQLEQVHGERAVLIVGDTLARISAGSNENSGEDMGVVVQRIDAIRSATGAAFLLVHHCGKDAARGMRGWSGLRAAVDTEIEIVADDVSGLRTAEITKQRDLPGKGNRFGFRLEPVVVGENQWGSPRTSCVVVAADAPDRPKRGKRISEIAGAIAEFLTQRGTGCLKGALVKHFENRYVRQSVYKEIKKMTDAGVLIETAGVVALPGAPGLSPMSPTVAERQSETPLQLSPTVATPFRGGDIGDNGDTPTGER